MASKNNIRSIRISDDMLELIEQQVGNNFTEKWENLVTRCIWELPNKEKQLKWVQEETDKERELLSTLRKKRQQLDAQIIQLQNIVNRAIQTLEQL